jgi:alcohol dehydrogenase
MAVTQFKSLFSQATKKVALVMVKSRGSDLTEVAKLISAGQIRPVIDQVFPIQHAAQAHDYSRSLRAKGKIILEIKK